MNTESWERAKHAFHAAVEAEPARQAETIAAVCGSDHDAKAEAARMLAHAEPQQDSTPPAAEHHDASPRRIGRFEVLRLVGAGATGKVYAAHDPQADRTVAIKILRLNVDTESMRRRLEYEGTVLAGLHHPNIARVYETGIANTDFGALPYIAMQYLEGTPIDTFAADHELDDRARVELVAHACAAVAHAHEHGVIHRDLKPTNIIVDRAGNPLLIDFGIASHTAALSDIDSLATHTGDLLGTPGYMSPEQRHGQTNAIDTRTDVYALGIILYELLARHRMFDVAGLPLIAALEAMESSPVPLLSDARPSCRGPLEAIVTKATHPSPRCRYNSAASLAEDLDRFLHAQEPHAPPVTGAYRARRALKRHRAVLTISLAVVLALAIALASQHAAKARADRRLAFLYPAIVAASALSSPEVALVRLHEAEARFPDADPPPDVTRVLFDTIGARFVTNPDTRDDAARAYAIAYACAQRELPRAHGQRLRALQVYTEALCMSGRAEHAIGLLTEELDDYWAFQPHTRPPPADDTQYQRLLRLSMTQGDAMARLGDPDGALQHLRAVLAAQTALLDSIGEPDHSDPQDTADMIIYIEDHIESFRRP